MDTHTKRTIAVVITHRAPYGRLKAILHAIQADSRLTLKIIVGTPVSLHSLYDTFKHGSASSFFKGLPWYIRGRLKTIRSRGDVSGHHLLARIIRKDGFTIDHYLPMFLDGGDLETMLKVQGNVLFELPDILKEVKPDILLVHADRFEMLPVAIVGATLNIPVVHTQGGDVSGTIDETVRHAITKLAHIHFPTTERSRQRIIQMGEDPRFVVMTGCPTVDTLKGMDLSIDEGIYKRNGKGYGGEIDLTKPFMLVLQHPVTTEYKKSKQNMEALLAAVRTAHMPTLLFWPNIDGGTDGASVAVREFIEDPGVPALSLYKHFNAEDFYRALNAAAVAVGNSSSFIREGSCLGTPVVMVGTRQQERERAENVLSVGYVQKEIEDAIKKQLAHGKYPQSTLYGDGTASKKIADALATLPLPSVQKAFRTLT